MLRGEEALKGKREVCDVGVGVGLAHTGAQTVRECWLEVVGGEVAADGVLLMQLWCHTDCKSSVL